MNEMLETELEEVILKEICQNRPYPKSIDEIIVNLDTRYNEFNPIQNSFELEPYFGTGKGVERAKKLLLNDGKIKSEWLRPYFTKEGAKKNDIRGLYIFIFNSTPFYVGISKSVVSRISQHLKGKSHYTSTLAYKIGLILYEFTEGNSYGGGRKEFEFEKYIEPAKKFLMKQNIALFHMENSEELALFEIYCSMKLKTRFNDFETH